ncbi:serine protease inhibitor 42Dd [Drosophila rhopaloa]|uniref:Ovalbumin-related protein X-like n=1 Tax=Drosophila rhopaloa TaxID=1041015 RepID=A0A6P4EHU8_DRORH|nr:serine protease inhibitor 42Dd [Drosophila rhopaloa]
MKYLSLILLATSVSCRFSEDFYGILAKENAKKNIISSPLSVEIIMSVVYMAAGGRTSQELRKSLRLPVDKKDVARKYKEFFANIQGREKEVILDMANRIYMNRKYRLVPEFNLLVRESFKADAKAISVDDPGGAASVVNNWVSNQTRGKIQHIVSSSDMNSDLSAILVNAIYFKGIWKHEFNADQTHTAEFHVSTEESVPVQLMSLSGSFRAAFLHNLDAKVIELPYRNSSLSMRIFLPNRIDGLSKLEEQIAGFSITLRKSTVNIKLPKFKIKFGTQLKAILQKLGIREVFKPSANLKGLVMGSDVKIDKVVQKAYLKVDEKGSKAAASTGVLIRRKKSVGLPQQLPMEFIADHPFVYVICDQNTIYFQGHIVKPQ